MAAPFEIPEWLLPEPSSSPPPPPVDDHRVEGLVNGFIAGKQDALFDAPDAYYRQQGRDAVDGAPAIVQRLQDLRTATLDRAHDDAERAALGPRLDAHIDDAMDGIGRHLDAQQQVLQRQIIATRQGLIQRAAALEHDNDDKIVGLAEAHASAAQERARLDGVAPGSDDEAAVLNAARSQILRTAIEQRIANAKGPQAISLYDRMTDTLTPADRRALEVPIGATRDDTATDAWLARESAADGPPLADRVASDDGLTDLQRLILQAKIGARESAAESSRVATVKGLDDQLAAATKAIATQPAQYRIGAFNALAQAYDAAGEPDKANDTRRLASQESVLRLFAQAGVGAQQRALQDLSGPERTMAEAIMNHQVHAFAKDPYAAGTALYPDIGPALPEDDSEGRLRQTRMVEARRGTSAPLQTVQYVPNNQSASETTPGFARGGQAPFTGPEPAPGSSAFLAADAEAQRLNEQPPIRDGGTADRPLSSMYDALAPDPEAKYGTILPFKIDPKGMHLALPMILRSGLKGYLDLLSSVDTGVLTPEAIETLFFGNLTAGVLGAERGALGAFGARSGSGLPMDTASRMACAEEMGFRKLPITYHGTDKDITPGFLLKPPSRATTAPTAETGIWTAENPEVAAYYASKAAGTEAPSGQSIVPIRARADKLAVVDAKDAKMTEMAGAILDAWDKGYDAVRVINVDWNGKPEVFWVFKDPKQLRSPNARFDPTQRESTDLLSGKVAPVPVAPSSDWRQQLPDSLRKQLPNSLRPTNEKEV